MSPRGFLEPLKTATFQAICRQGVPRAWIARAYAKWQAHAAPQLCDHEGPGDLGRAIDCQCRGCRERGCLAMFEQVYQKLRQGEL